MATTPTIPTDRAARADRRYAQQVASPRSPRVTGCPNCAGIRRPRCGVATSGLVCGTTEVLARTRPPVEYRHHGHRRSAAESCRSGGADRQPLLRRGPRHPRARKSRRCADPCAPVRGGRGDDPAGASTSIRAAQVLVDGDLCEACSCTPVRRARRAAGQHAIDMTIDPGLGRVSTSPGAEPSGYPEQRDGRGWREQRRVRSGRCRRGSEVCRPYDMAVEKTDGALCPSGEEVFDCGLRPRRRRHDPLVRGPKPRTDVHGNVLPPVVATMILYCFHGSACDDASVTGSCAIP